MKKNTLAKDNQYWFLGGGNDWVVLPVVHNQDLSHQVLRVNLGVLFCEYKNATSTTYLALKCVMQFRV